MVQIDAKVLALLAEYSLSVDESLYLYFRFMGELCPPNGLELQEILVEKGWIVDGDVGNKARLLLTALGYFGKDMPYTEEFELYWKLFPKSIEGSIKRGTDKKGTFAEFIRHNEKLVLSGLTRELEYRNATGTMKYLKGAKRFLEDKEYLNDHGYERPKSEYFDALG